MKTIHSLLLLLLISFSSATIHAQLIPDWVSYYANNKTAVTSIAVDTQAKCIYIAGFTADSFGIATAGAHKEDIGPVVSWIGVDAPEMHFWNTDVFIAKFDMHGNRIWGTYYGGIGREMAVVMQLDHEGNIIITGSTDSEEGIASAGSYQSEKILDSTNIRFIAKFAPSGDQLWGTYYEHELDYTSNAYSTLAIDADNNIYITNNGNGTISPTPGAHQMVANGYYDGYIAKFDPEGGLVWATYVGGEAFDQINDIRFAADGHIYIAGVTAYSYTGIATSGTYQSELLIPNHYGGVLDSSSGGIGFINKFTTDGERVWGTYISSTDSLEMNTTPMRFISAYKLASDGNSNIYVMGSTNVTTHIATPGTYKMHLQGGGAYEDMFLMKFDNSGQKLWGTYYGAEGWERKISSGTYSNNQLLVTTPNGKNIYVKGGLSATDGMETSCSEAATGPDYIIRFNETGKMESINRYLGDISHIALDPRNGSNHLQDIYIAGRSDVDGLATVGAFKDNMLGQLYAGLFGKLTETCPPSITLPIALTAGVLSVSDDYTDYTWYHNGVAIAGSDTSIWNVGADTNGYYFAEVKTCACHYFSDTFYFDPLSIAPSTDRKSTITIYPNPSSELTTLSLANIDAEIKSIKVTDVIGTTLLSDNNIKRGKADYTFSVTDFSPGIYFIHIQAKNNSFSGKLIVE